MVDQLLDKTYTMRLHTSDPGTGGGNEVETNGQKGYGRPSIPPSLWPSAAAGDADNNTAISFGTASANWSGAVTHVTMWDGATRYGKWALGSPKTILSGQEAVIAAGVFDFDIDPA